MFIMIRNINYNYQRKMTNNLQENIFFEQNNTGIHHNNVDNDSLEGDCLPYLQRGDSSKYLEQFLLKEKTKSKELNIKPQQVNRDNSESSSQSQQSNHINVKNNTSSFHNFQKHLTVCLRNTISIKDQQETLKDYQVLASKLWKLFKSSSFSTKKILHYLLGDKNQHKVTMDGLIQYGFHKIINNYDQKTIKLAKNYLREETLRQINDGKVNQYIKSKKLKDKQKFQKYVQFFVQQLQQGFLRKRLPKDKVFELQRS